MSKDMKRASGRAAPGRAVWALTAAMAVAGAWVWLLPSIRGAAAVGRPEIGVGVFMAIAIAGDFLWADFEYRQQTHTLTFVEVPLVVALVYCRPSSLLVAGLISFALVQSLVRHQGMAKLSFNLGMRGLEYGLATLVFRAALGHASPIGTRGWLAAYVAVLASDALSFVAVLAAIRVTSGSFDRAGALVVAQLNLAVATANTGLGLVTVLLLHVDARGVLLLAGVALILAALYRQYTTVRQRYANLRLLYGFSDALASTQPGSEVYSHILGRSAEIVRAEHVELLLRAGQGWSRFRLGPEGMLERDHTARLDAVSEAVVARQAGVRVSATAHGALRDELVAAGHRDAIATPLVFEDGQDGVLLARDRTSDVSTFDDEDLALFQALAAHASVALRNAQLVDRLTEEAAHRAYQALHDALTGLGNRELFAERVKAALGEDRGLVAVMLMDLDEFKEVNDTLGHHTGDTVLREIAARLTKVVGSRGTVARLGGDEFAVAIPGCRDADDALLVALDVRNSVEQPLEVEELVLELHASIGVSLSPVHGSDPAVLLQRADVAMYSAKGARRGVELYSPERDHYSQRRLALSGELRQAIEAGALDLYFQPKAALADGAVTSLEALVRWHHPKHGFVPPDEFIPVAEQSGLIGPLTRWVLGQALRQLALWRRSGLDLTVAVNLSARSLLDAGLLEDIARALAEANVPPSALVLELTESTVMSDPDRSQMVLQSLADLGCRLSIDDFGTGYSSLSRLKQLPVYELKIDKSFVLHMATDTEDAAIVRSIIDLARNLGLKVVAEGVEDEETLDRLRALGCDSIQGFHLCRPQPGAELAAWFDSHPVRRFRRFSPVPVPSREVAFSA